jgi:two-component system, cell cycle sensor histidine kinase and response regulator CckA
MTDFFATHARQLFDGHHAAMLLIDPREGRIVDANPAAERFYGWDRDMLVGKRMADINTLSPEAIKAEMDRARANGQSVFRFRHRVADGSVRDVDVITSAIEGADGPLLHSLVLDAAARNASERTLERLTRLYAMLSATNQLVVRGTEPPALFDGLCRIAVEEGGFLFAWVGLQSAEGGIVPVARAGQDHGYIDAIQPTLRAEDGRARGLSGEAMRRGRPVIHNAFLEDPALADWHAPARRAGVGSAAAFPLRQDDAVIGALILYSGDPAFFTPREVDTLLEMTGDVAFGLTQLRRAAEHRETAVREAHWYERLVRYLGATSAISFAFERTDQGFVPAWVSPNISRVLGYSVDEALSPRWWAAHVHPEDRPRAEAERATVVETGHLRHEYRVRRADGRLVWILDEVTYVPASSDAPAQLIGVWTDITARKEAESRLQASETRLRLALEAGGQGTWDFDVASGIAIVSDEYAEMLDEDPRTFHENATAWRDRLHPDDAGVTIRRMDELFAGQHETFRMEFRQRTRSGHWLWTQSTGRVVERYANGAARRVIGTHTDISARKALEEAQRARDVFNSRLLESLTEGVVACDAEGRLTLFNAAAREWHGIGPDDGLDPTQWADRYALFTADGTRPLATEEIPLVRAWHGERVRDAAMVIRAEGRPDRYVVSSGGPLRAGDGTLIGALVVMHDLTDVRNAEASLRLRGAALEAAAGPIVIVDPTGRVEWANAAHTTLTGYGLDELVGVDPATHPALRDPVIAEGVATTVRTAAPWRGERVTTRRDGTAYTEAVSMTPVLDDAGTVLHVVVLKRDRSEELDMQARLLHSQKLEGVGRLAGGVAHDFNNVLTVINGTLDLALLQLPPDDPLAVDLREARLGGERAAALTRQLLAFSRQQVVRPLDCRLNEIIAQLTKMLSRLIGEDVRLELQLAPALDTVVADPGQIEQMLLNMAVNARDAMPEGGTLTIRTANVRLDPSHPAMLPGMGRGPYVLISVEDTGTGMDEAVRSRIFEPFFTTKEVGKGTGLGLATVYGIVQQSGGNVAVDSTVGVGTRFDVYLPAGHVAPSAAASAPAAPTENGHATILVVDDEPPLRMIAERILRRAGYRVITAADGAEALQRLAEAGGSIDLMFTDVVMPGMSGVVLAEQVRTKHPAVRILFTSGYTDDTTTRHGLSTERVDFLPKPYSMDQLARAIADALGRRD